MSLFATPASRSTTATATRRSLEFSRASSTNPQHTGNSSGGQSVQESAQLSNETNSASTNEEVLSMLRSLQQQVSTMQAQQTRAASERTARNQTSTPNSSLNDKRKLPKELSVSLV